MPIPGVVRRKAVRLAIPQLIVIIHQQHPPGLGDGYHGVSSWALVVPEG